MTIPFVISRKLEHKKKGKNSYRLKTKFTDHHACYMSNPTKHIYINKSLWTAEVSKVKINSVHIKSRRNIKHLKRYQLTRTEELSQKRESTTRNNTQLHIIEYEMTKLAFEIKLVQRATHNPHSHSTDPLRTLPQRIAQKPLVQCG